MRKLLLCFALADSKNRLRVLRVGVCSWLYSNHRNMHSTFIMLTELMRMYAFFQIISQSQWYSCFGLSVSVAFCSLLCRNVFLFKWNGRDSKIPNYRLNLCTRCNHRNTDTPLDQIQHTISSPWRRNCNVCRT